MSFLGETAKNVFAWIGLVQTLICAAFIIALCAWAGTQRDDSY